MKIQPTGKIIWLGQSVRSRFVSLEYKEICSTPIILSLGEAISRPEYIKRFFSKALKPQFGISGNLMLDSGGFMMMANSDNALPIDQLLNIYKNTDADVFVSLDFPPSLTENRFERERKYSKTKAALEYLLKGLNPKNLMPVIHGRTISEVENNISIVKKYYSDFSFIGLGGIVPLLKQKNNGVLSDGRHSKEHIKSMIQAIRTSFPESILHAFGVGSPSTILALMAMGADSVDSVGWRFAANFGNIYLPGTPARFPTKEIIHTRHGRLALNGKELDLLAQCDCPVCKKTKTLEDRIAKLNSSYVPRAAHNAWVIKKEVCSLSIAIKDNSHHKFIESRVNRNWLSYIDFPTQTSSLSL